MADKRKREITAKVSMRHQLQRERDFNRALLQSLSAGFSREELLGRWPPCPYWHPDHLESTDAALQHVLTGKTNTVELAFRHKAGCAVWVEPAPSVIRMNSLNRN